MTTSQDSTRPPSEEEPLTADLPGFLQPRRHPSQDPTNLVTAVTEASPTSPGPELEDRDPDGESDGELDAPIGPSSKIPTVGPSQVFGAKASAFEPLIAMTVNIGGLAANTKLATEGNPHAWLPHEEEVEAIAGPLSRIVARHAPIKAGSQSDDIADGIEAAVATVGYVTRNMVETKMAAGEPGPEPPQ